MNSTLFERLRGFRIPQVAPIPEGHHIVALLRGIDFDGVFNSPDFEFENALDARFGKMMVRTSSHLLGGDACGRYAHTELTELSVLLDRAAVAERWEDPTVLQNYLVGLASTRMTLLLDDEALFDCSLFAFDTPDLVVAYFAWRQQETYIATLDAYLRYALARDDNSTPEGVATLLNGLGPREKEEILAQNEIDFQGAPAWQRYGSGVALGADGGVLVDTNLPRDSAAYGNYLQQYL